MHFVRVIVLRFLDLQEKGAGVMDSITELNSWLQVVNLYNNADF